MDLYTGFLLMLVPTSIMVWLTKGHIAERFMSYRTMRKKKKEMHAKVQNEVANLLRMMVATNQISSGDRHSVEKRLARANYDVSDEPTYGKPVYKKASPPRAETLKRQIRDRLGPKVQQLMNVLKLRRKVKQTGKSNNPYEGLKVKKRT